MISGNSRDATLYKITLIININSQFTALTVMEIQDFSTEISKLQLGLARFLKLRMTQIPLGIGKDA